MAEALRLAKVQTAVCSIILWRYIVKVVIERMSGRVKFKKNIWPPPSAPKLSQKCPIEVSTVLQLELLMEIELLRVYCRAFKI